VRRRPSPPAGWACRSWPSTRPTSPASPAATGCPAPSGRCGAGCAPCTARRAARWRRAGTPWTELRRNGVERVDRWARGVDLARFSPGHRDEPLHRRLAADGSLLVGYVGRLAHEKEVGLLSWLRDLPGVQLVVVGDGPQRAALQSRLPGVPFLGFQGGGQLATTFASLDVFVHTGSSETFCQAAQEALASGVPVVAPAAGGLLDLVDDGRNGLLFDPGSGASLRDRIHLLSHDEDVRREMARAARASVEGRTWDVIGDQLVRHYEQVVPA
jgi:phosphatidylinositol alpha 1,6-mannosyltransferase